MEEPVTTFFIPQFKITTEGTGEVNFNKILSQFSDEVNDSLKTFGYTEAPYKPGTIVDTIELTEQTIFVRVYDGVNSQQAGGWVIKAEDITGLNLNKFKINLPYLALQNM